MWWGLLHACKSLPSRQPCSQVHLAFISGINGCSAIVLDELIHGVELALTYAKTTIWKVLYIEVLDPVWGLHRYRIISRLEKKQEGV